ncbi:MAG: TlpA disulfide reductase family protein [Bacteroidota bacterium]
MRKISILILAVITLFSCKEEAPKDYVTLQGKIVNPNNKTLTILGENFKKEITVNDDGSFKDTLKVKDGFHGFNDGKQQSFVYLKNGYDLNLDFDAQNFPGSISFKGNGSSTNIYLTNKLLFIQNENLNNFKVFFVMDKPEFDENIARISNKMDEMLANAEDLDPEVIKLEKESNKKMVEFFTMNYEKEHEMLAAFKPGTPSPKFNYPDINGKNISLDDLKGKYVYVDVWATWCAPCKREIPYLKDLNKEYLDKDITFVSLSIDKMEDKDKWIKMVKDKNLEGVQIMADNAWNSDFVTNYGIKGIPRFILIDKEGNILDSDAPRPSDPRLKKLFDSLDI